MNEFDVIVIGGGPAGCYAGLTAAVQGLKVAIFEEHGAIGWPRHDPGWLMESDFTASLINAIGKSIPWHKIKDYRVCDAKSGKTIEKSEQGGYIVRRDFLEKELACSAVNAGAKLYLKTKVTGLLKDDGKIEGVKTNSLVIPEAQAQIIICADGIRSTGNGFALAEGLCSKGKGLSGISYLLANAEVEPGVIEHFVSSEPLLNYRCFFTHERGVSFLGVQSYEDFQELKDRTDNAVSLKIKNAYPVEINGYSRISAGKYGYYFNKIVNENILFIGDASGGSGNIHGMIQGKLAGTIAASAIKENDISEKRLMEYQDEVQRILAKAPFCWFSAREDFGSFNEWFNQFNNNTRGIEATELV